MQHESRTSFAIPWPKAEWDSPGRSACVVNFREAVGSRPRYSTIAHEFEQVAVRIEKIATIVVAPIDYRRDLYTSSLKALGCFIKIRAIDLKGVMTLAERMLDTCPAFVKAQRQAGDFEEREILGAASHQNLIAKARRDAQSEHCRIKPFGASEFIYFEAKMVELFKLHSW